MGIDIARDIGTGINRTNLQFSLGKFPFITKRIHYCIISFNGDCK